MAVKKRCGFCNKHLVNAGTKENPKWECKNKKCPRYVPDPEPEPVEPKPETPSEDTTTPSEGNTTSTVETPSTGEPVQSGGNTETEPTP